MKRALFALALTLGLAAPPATAGENTAWGTFHLIAPLSREGFLWAPPLPLLGRDEVALQFDYSEHHFDGLLDGVDSDASTVLLAVRAEYTFWRWLTLGMDLPFLVSSDVDLHAGNLQADSSSLDLGNLRLHLRAHWVLPEYDLALGVGFRLWLPTNTFLTLNFDRWGETEVWYTFAVFEPMLSLAWGRRPLSLQFTTGPRVYAVEEIDDFTFWSFDLILGAAPIPQVPELEFVLELNWMVELDDNDAPSIVDEDRSQPLAISIGARYHFGPVGIELGARFGLHDAAAYTGDVQVGVALSYRLPGGAATTSGASPKPYR